MSQTLVVPLTKGEREMMEQDSSPVEDFRDEWQKLKGQARGLVKWLLDQYVGERNAVASMEQLREAVLRHGGTDKVVALVDRVLNDERRHVATIGRLLVARGETNLPVGEPVVLEGLDDPNAGPAFVSRAEAVRAGIIRVVVDDPDVPADIREVFQIILKEERFHEEAFRAVAGEKNMAEHAVFQSWCGGCCTSPPPPPPPPWPADPGTLPDPAL